MKRTNDISACITGALETYLRDLDGEKPAAIYEMVLKSVERPMLPVAPRIVMDCVMLPLVSCWFDCSCRSACGPCRQASIVLRSILPAAERPGLKP